MITTAILVLAVLVQSFVSLTGLALCLYSITQAGKAQQATLESALRYLASRNSLEKVQADVAEKVAEKELETTWNPDSILEQPKARILVHDAITGEEVDLSGPGWDVL